MVIMNIREYFHIFHYRTPNACDNNNNNVILNIFICSESMVGKMKCLRQNHETMNVQVYSSSYEHLFIYTFV